jgi:hypothetical protein
MDMKRQATILAVICIMTAVVLPLMPRHVFASESLPAIPVRFYGTVTVAGSLSPNGTVVTAEVDGQVQASSTTNGGKYGWGSQKFTVTATAGQTVVFKVAGNLATNRSLTSSEGPGSIIKQDLTVQETQGNSNVQTTTAQTNYVSSNTANTNINQAVPPSIPNQEVSQGGTNSNTIQAVVPVTGAPVFSVSGLAVSPSTARPGEKVNIIALCSNKGTTTGIYTAALKLNGKVEQTRAVTVDPGSTRKISFEVIKISPGQYTLEIDGNKVSFRVGGATAINFSWILTGVGLMILILIIAVIVRKRYAYEN